MREKLYNLICISAIVLSVYIFPTGLLGKCQQKIRLDTLNSVFLYEVNIPEVCYTRFDQIEQGHNMILYNKDIKRKSIDLLYKSGVYCLSYEAFISNFEHSNNLNLFQNKYAIEKFKDSIVYFKHRNRNYERSLIHDKTGKLFYKKIVARLVVVHLGPLKQLIPNNVNYKCCYSNFSKPVDTYFVVDVLSFKIY